MDACVVVGALWESDSMTINDLIKNRSAMENGRFLQHEVQSIVGQAQRR